MQTDLSLLKNALPYIRSYKDTCFVVKLSGALCVPGPDLDHVAQQLSMLHQLGTRLVVVHGGGKQATELAERLGVQTEFVNGRRITSGEMLEVTKMAFAGTINTDLTAAFHAQGLPAVGMSGIAGGIIAAKRRPPVKVKDAGTGEIRSVDFGYVGDIVGTDGALLTHLISAGYVPVVGSLAADEHGQVLNINADTMASRIAQGIGAVKLILLTNVDGVMRDLSDHASLYAALDIAEAESLMATGVIHGGMLVKLTTSIEALKAGVPRVHIVNGLAPEALLKEIFTNEGSGTLIVPSREAAV